MLMCSATQAHAPLECEHLFLAFGENAQKMQLTMMELKDFTEREANALDNKLNGFKRDLDRRTEIIAVTLELAFLEGQLYDSWLLVVESQSEAVKCIYPDQARSK